MPGVEYEIRVRGRVGETLRASFEGLDAEVEPAETVLRRRNLDQAELQDVLERLRLFGLELIEVRRLRRADVAPPRESPALD
jgi:hypothetical protein